MSRKTGLATILTFYPELLRKISAFAHESVYSAVPALYAGSGLSGSENRLELHLSFFEL
jgi:hypothetical protein